MRLKLLLAAIIISICGCTSVYNQSDIKDNFVELRAGSGFFLYPSPQPESLGELEEIEAGVKVEMLDSKDQWIHIKHNGVEGWIPKWYVNSEGSEQVVDISSQAKTLNQDYTACLYPDGPKIADLDKGKLLTPIKEWNEWYEVKIIVYDIPAIQLAWVPQNVLSTIGEIEPIEGYLRPGTEVYEVHEYEKIPLIEPNRITHEMIVFIISKKDDYILVGANGGWSAWTKKQNLVYTLES